MRLLASLTSPYARKLRVMALELGLPVEVVETSPMDDGPALLSVNPLGKVPALVLDDGTALVDSRVISGYLLAQVPGTTLLPADGPAHWHVRTTEAIADGVLDAAINLRFNAAQQITSGLWVDRQYRAIDRAMGALAIRVGDNFGFAEICIVTACEYLDLRFPGIDWRGAQPPLAALQARLTDRASFAATRPPQA
ncbi:MAG: glutathione S-transferase N-terminal domain-containing protein [Sandarakinorhabdus sp.]|nr:glutathione S-transferase N-terminal domain-containing protein [Sandarakinorhabdus sp.]